MIQEIKLFMFILSVIFLLKNLLLFGIKFFQTEPEPMKITKTEIILLYLSISYFITFLFT